MMWTWRRVAVPALSALLAVTAAGCPESEVITVANGRIVLRLVNRDDGSVVSTLPNTLPGDGAVGSIILELPEADASVNSVIVEPVDQRAMDALNGRPLNLFTGTVIQVDTPAPGSEAVGSAVALLPAGVYRVTGVFVRDHRFVRGTDPLPVFGTQCTLAEINPLCVVDVQCFRPPDCSGSSLPCTLECSESGGPCERDVDCPMGPDDTCVGSGCPEGQFCVPDICEQPCQEVQVAEGRLDVELPMRMNGVEVPLDLEVEVPDSGEATVTVVIEDGFVQRMWDLGWGQATNCDGDTGNQGFNAPADPLVTEFLFVEAESTP